jgi:L-amino acid N-acyltransferase YncA
MTFTTAQLKLLLNIAAPFTLAIGVLVLRKNSHKTRATPILIRPATLEDIPAILAIYCPHANDPRSIVTFEEKAPDLKEMIQRWQHVVSNNDPYLVATRSGVVVGFVYSHPFRSRAAYRFTTEISVYVKNNQQGSGVGSLLMEALIAQSKQNNKKSLIAVLGSSELQSWYSTFGFRTVGVFRQVGYKAKCGWIDRTIMELVFESKHV